MSRILPHIGLLPLISAYFFSQFYRSMLAVMAPDLEASIGAGPSDLAFASGLWFAVFAAMQIPIGAALDRVGPRLIGASLFLLGGAGGSIVMAMAQEPWHITLAMVLNGIGCAPVLMASYMIFARSYPPVMFATLGAIVLTIGSLGNILASMPMSWAMAEFGWRTTLYGLSAVNAAIALLMYLLVKNPPKVEVATAGSLFDLLKIRALWPILAIAVINYMPAAALRGVWVGPFHGEVYGSTAEQIGQISLLMSIAMTVGSLMYGPLDRIFKTRKWVVVAGNTIGGCACGALALWGADALWISVSLYALIGLSCATFAVIMAHGRAFFPAHLAGRGVTLINLFGISGVSIGQLVSRNIYDSYEASANGGVAAFNAIHGFLAIAIFTGIAIYLLSQDRID